MKLSPAFVGKDTAQEQKARGWMRTKRRWKAPWCCGPTKNIKWYAPHFVFHFSPFCLWDDAWPTMSSISGSMRWLAIAKKTFMRDFARENLGISKTMRLQDISLLVQFNLPRRKTKEPICRIILFCTMTKPYPQLSIRIIFKEKCEMRINIRVHVYAKKYVHK